jgi:uncharacterized protein YabE (DUF348 family)
MVSLYVDGQKRLFPSNAATVGDVLKKFNVKLGPNDLVEPAAGTALTGGEFNINVYRAQPVTVEDGLQTYHVHSAYQSPRLLALAAGLTVYPEDTFSTGIITDIVDNGSIGEKVTVQRAKPVTVQVDGQTRQIRTQAGTVGEALKGAGIALGLKDTVSAAPAAPLLPGMTVSITRVTEAVVTLTQSLPRPVQTVNDPTLLKGQTAVKQDGADGQKTTTYRIHYQNGVETGREVLQVVSQTAPVPEIKVVGTKVIFAGSVEYWRPQVVAAATAWNIDPNMMLRIMACESRGNASDVSAFVINGQHPTGLFQYLPSTWIAAGGTMENIFDGSVQIKLTAKKMATEGTKAWQCQ